MTFVWDFLILSEAQLARYHHGRRHEDKHGRCFKDSYYHLINYHDQSDLEKKWFIQLSLPHHSSSLNDIRTGTQAEQELGARSRCRDQEGVLLIGKVLMAHSVSFLLETRTTSSGIALSVMGWALSNTSTTQKMPTVISYGGMFSPL